MPPASSINCAYWLTAPGPPASLSISPTFKMFSRPSRATWMILLSMEFRRSHIGLMQPCVTRYRIWFGSCSPPEVAFEIAQHASFLVLKSAFWRMLSRGGMMLLSLTSAGVPRPSRWIYASIIAEICIGLPAVIFEMVQHASFLIPSLGEESKLRRAGSAPDEITTCVCRSSPVTMLPTDRKAGVCTAVEGCLNFRQLSSRPPPILNSHEQVDQSPTHSTLYHSLDLIVRPVRQIADGPAGIDEHLVIEGVDEFRQDSQGGCNLKLD